MKNQRAARRYAVALMAVAEETKSVEAVAADLASLGATLHGSRELRVLLASPVVRGGRKTAVLEELFGKRFGPVTMRFLALMALKGREGILPEVAEEFAALRDRKAGVVTADVTSAVALDREQAAALRTRLEGSTGTTVRLRLHTDPSLRGGLVVQLGDTVLDASIRRQLERLHDRLLHGDTAGTQA